MSKLMDEAELKESYKSSDRLYLSVRHKRNFDNINFWVDPDSDPKDRDYIIGIGTYFNETKHGGDLLPDLMKSYRSGGIGQVRREITGIYAFMVKTGTTARVFVDPLGLHDLYYSEISSTEWCLCNSLSIVAQVAGATPIYPHIMIEGFIRLPGRDSMFDGVFRLLGPEYLEWRTDEPNKGLTRGRTALRESDIAALSLAGAHSREEANELFAGKVKKLFHKLSSFGTIAINITGGMDSRMVLAGLTSEKLSFSLQYGVGNSRLTNTRESDFQIVKRFSDGLRVPLRRMDWSGTQPHSPDAERTLFAKYGFNYHIYGGSEGLIASLRSLDQKLQLAGFGPPFANMKVWQAPIVTLEDMIEHFISYPSKYLLGNEYKKEKSYREAVNKVTRSYLKDSYAETVQKHFDPKYFNRYLRTWVQVRPESEVLNFYNEFSYALAPFHTWDLFVPMVSLPAEHREGDWFQMALIAKLDSSLLDYPFYSGLKEVYFDKNSLNAKLQIPPPKDGALRQNLRKSLLNILPDALTYRYFSWRTRNMKQTEEAPNDAILASCRERLSKSAIAKDFRGYFGMNVFQIHRLARLLDGAKMVQAYRGTARTTSKQNANSR